MNSPISNAVMIVQKIVFTHVYLSTVGTKWNILSGYRTEREVFHIYISSFKYKK